MQNNEIKKQNKYFYKVKEFIKKYWWQILISFGGVVLVSALGGVFTNPDTNWFISLAKPEFYPPNWLFGVVWSILYALIAVGLIRVISKKVNSRTIWLYIINGILNVLWSYMFFELKTLFGAVIVLVVLIIFAYLLLKDLYNTDKIAFYLTLPYFIWLLFAFMLNYSIYFLN